MTATTNKELIRRCYCSVKGGLTGGRVRLLPNSLGAAGALPSLFQPVNPPLTEHYEELWNHWNLDVADEIIAEDIAFRGSLSVTGQGRDGFKQ